MLHDSSVTKDDFGEMTHKIASTGLCTVERHVRLTAKRIHRVRGPTTLRSQHKSYADANSNSPASDWRWRRLLHVFGCQQGPFFVTRKRAVVNSGTDSLCKFLKPFEV